MQMFTRSLAHSDVSSPMRGRDVEVATMRTFGFFDRSTTKPFVPDLIHWKCGLAHPMSIIDENVIQQKFDGQHMKFFHSRNV